ncbi:hypothetical protein AMTR_s00132p00106640 [Amborella trichopoda]|uniref:Uncharacterized protein n=1 Tax=Amborella trichopoda TaxID=13333 RepID=W1NDG3_AMBTC|nr:hypothetical protein AMTR_s00132p00106640 [Amborella trichopoda]
MNRKSVPVAPKRGSLESKKSFSILGTSPSPLPAKHARAVASTILTPPPMVSISSLRVELEVTMVRPERSELTSFFLSHKLGRAPSPIVVVVMPPVANPVGSPIFPSLSPGDFLYVSGAEPKLELPLDVPSSKLLVVSVEGMPSLEVHAEEPSSELYALLSEASALIVYEATVSAEPPPFVTASPFPSSMSRTTSDIQWSCLYCAQSFKW